jgi:Immunoglobulin domain
MAVATTVLLRLRDLLW